jgi:uncharacterized protein YggU (UPF0235/DUF167 family)
VTTFRITVRLTPKGGRDAIEGWMEFAGERVLKARVAAAPEGGNANAALIALLAHALAVPKSRIRLAAGETSRRKILEIDGDPNRLNAIGDAP